MIFIKDEFSTEYFQIISTAQLRANTKKLAQKLFPLTIIEKHHIIPDSFYINRKREGNGGWLSGNPSEISNLVFLTSREHYRCHWLLSLMTLDDITYHILAKVKMANALNRMSGKGVNFTRYELSESEYVFARKNLSKLSSKCIVSEGSIKKQLATKLKNGTLNCSSTESIQKGLDTKTVNNTLPSNPIIKDKAKATRLSRYGTLNTSSPESIAKILSTKISNNTLASNLLIKAKTKATKLKNNSGPSAAETIKKQQETKLKNGTLQNSLEVQTKSRNTKEANHNKFICEICKKKYSYEKSLVNHIDRH